MGSFSLGGSGSGWGLRGHFMATPVLWCLMSRMLTLTVWVMLLLALPAAYVKGRSGSLGLKLGLGIAAGLGFHLVNSLFSHLGLLGAWPPVAVVFLPSLFALLFALSLFSWVQRRGL